MEGFEEKDDGLPFYRCILCGGIVSVWDIKKSYGCPKCKGTRVKPTDMSFVEKMIQVIKHPAVWKWKEIHIE
jgi:DNA-directed RNA polymerase subunit RPC12/RpoP